MLHTADVHLDSPFTLEDASRSEARRNELRSAFASMMMYVKTNNIDLMLIAGDFIDNEFATKDTVSFLIREFEKVPECRIVISPGNHDPFTPNSVYKKTVFPDNVYVFSSNELDRFCFDDIGVHVYGYAFTSGFMEQNPFINKRPTKNDVINILCAHGDTASPISKYCPITERDIAESGFDYIALGHIHNSNGVMKEGDTYYAYSGCLEGRDYSESGFKGALVGNFSKGEFGFNADIKGIRFSKRRYANEKLNITAASHIDEVAEAMQQLIIKNGYGEDTLLRVTLEGNVSPELNINRPVLMEKIRKLYSLDLVDETLPLYDYEKLKNDPTIRGAFFNAMLPLLQSGTLEEREQATRALRYGLSALDGSDIIDF